MAEDSTTISSTISPAHEPSTHHPTSSHQATNDPSSAHLDTNDPISTLQPTNDPLISEPPSMTDAPERGGWYYFRNSGRGTPDLQF